MLKTDMVIALLGHSYGLQQGGLRLTPATHMHHGYVVNLQLCCTSVHFFPHPSLAVCSLNMFSAELSLERYWQGLRSQEVGEKGDNTYCYTVTARMVSALRQAVMIESHFNVSLIVRGKNDKTVRGEMTRQSGQNDKTVRAK